MTAASTSQTRRNRTTAALFLIILIGPVTARAEGQNATRSPPRPPRIRTLDPGAAALLERGRELSPAIVGLIDIIEHSDVVAYVDTGLLQIPGRLRFAGTTPCGRLVRITINVLDQEMHRIAALGHELQHAVEIAETPGITDTHALARFYDANGFKKSRGGYCTRAADQMTTTVRAEVCQASSRPDTK